VSTVILLEIMLLASLSLIFLYQTLFALASFFSRKQSLSKPRIPTHRLAVIIPAHNEEMVIERCLRAVLSAEYPQVLRDIWVVADNCTDGTVEKVGPHPVLLLERNDRKNVGKGYAILWALELIGLQTVDAVLFVDADAAVSQNILLEIDRVLARGEKVIQVYNGTLNVEENWMTRCFHFSDVFQFLVYFKGREALGLTSRLLGNGMCLHREVLEKVPWRAFSITENWDYYFDVIRAGYRVAFTPSAYANSDQVVSFGQAKSQKSRWQTGWASAVRNHVPSIIMQAWREKKLKLGDAVIDFLLPSPSMQGGFLALALIGAVFVGHGLLQSWSLLLLMLASIGGVVCLKVGGAGFRDCLAIFYAPLYITWKFLLRIALTVGSGPKEWVRTARR